MTTFKRLPSLGYLNAIKYFNKNLFSPSKTAKVDLFEPKNKPNSLTTGSNWRSTSRAFRFIFWVPKNRVRNNTTNLLTTEYMNIKLRFTQISSAQLNYSKWLCLGLKVYKYVYIPNHELTPGSLNSAKINS